jgi:hypothetical protein
LDDYYSAGYFLIRKSKRPEWLDEPRGLVPDEIISLEKEFCPKFNVGWTWTPGDKPAALDFGIDEAKWAEFKHWCTDNHRTRNIEVWSMLRSTDVARRVMKQFIPESKWDGLMIIGAGLHKSSEPDWRDPYGTEGVETRILECLPMEKGGQVLGFDVSSYEAHNFDHTWFSHNHHKGVFQELGVRPGAYGLLQTREEAILARDYADAHDRSVSGYEYWLLVAYPLIPPTPLSPRH